MNTKVIVNALKENIMEWEDLFVVMRDNPTWSKERLIEWITKKATRTAEESRAALAAIEDVTPKP